MIKVLFLYLLVYGQLEDTKANNFSGVGGHDKTIHEFIDSGKKPKVAWKRGLRTLRPLRRLIINICYSPAGRSVLGETVPEVLSTARGRRPRAQFLPIRTDLGRWITFLFFSYWDLKVSGKFSFTLQPMCVKERSVRVDVIQSARSIANQNKTLQHDF